MRRSIAAVLLCVLVFAAGCSAIPGTGGDGGSGGTAESVPGVEDGRLADGTALLDAHVEAATATGFTQEISTNATQTINNETVVVGQRQQVRVAPDATEYRSRVVVSGNTSGRVLTWGNRTAAVRRVEVGGDPQYREVQPRPAEQLAGRLLLERRLSEEFEVTDIEERDDGPALVTMEVDALPANNTVFDDQETIENVREFEATLVVDTAGRVRSYTATAVYDLNGQPADYDFSLRMTSFEDPGVERPPWATSE
jgi:hypothetical protein